MLNPGPSLFERARELARSRNITFGQAMKELGQHARRKRGSNRAKARKQARVDSYISDLERKHLF